MGSGSWREEIVMDVSSGLSIGFTQAEQKRRRAFPTKATSRNKTRRKTGTVWRSKCRVCLSGRRDNPDLHSWETSHELI